MSIVHFTTPGLEHLISGSLVTNCALHPGPVVE